MPNPTNKQELLSAMADGYAKLNEQIGKTFGDTVHVTFCERE